MIWTCGGGVSMIDGEGEAREEWYNEATLPLFAFTMCANNAMYNRVTNLVLNSHVLHGRPILSIRAKQQTRIGEENTAYDVMKNWFSM
jgi:hypothetical protein